VSDLVFQTVRAVVLIAACGYLWRAGRLPSSVARQGWSLMLAGLGLMILASILDLTENIPSLGRLVVAGDPAAQTLLEKAVGFVGGCVLIAAGLILWVPTMTSIEELQSIHEALPHGLLIVEAGRSRILGANPAMCAMVGRSEEELRALSVEGLLPPDAPAEVRDRLAAAIARGCRAEEGFQLATREGEVVEARIVSSDRQVVYRGRPCGVVFVRDTCDRKEAERAIRQSEERLVESERKLRSIFENTADVIAYVDKFGRILDVNERVEDVFGYRREEIIGRHFARLGVLRLQDVPRIVRLFLDSLTAERAEEMVELELRAKNGEKVCVEVGTRFVRRNGKIETVVNVFRDLRERKRAMAELARAKATAEDASRAKGEFLAHMSHEIRTPMTAILGFADILLERVSDPESADAARTIRANGEYLLSIINDILDLSKIEAGRLQIEREPCSVVGIVAEVAKLMEVRAAAKNLALTVEYATPVPEIMHTDPVRLRQVLINLLGNAIKFTDAGGVRLVVGATPPPGPARRLQFEVIDTGVGIEESDLRRLFHPFAQGAACRGRQFAGTGLGLSISQRLAEMLGGGIQVARTAVGRGTAFTFTIDPGPADPRRLAENPPARRAEPDIAPAAAPPQRPRLDCHVLLVEDGLDNQRLVSLLLKKWGARVTVANDGQEAVAKALLAMRGAAVGEGAEEGPFDVILMDMQMPVMDGYEATRRLRQEGFSRPIIALTAYAMTDDRRKCLDAGCDDYLSKPIDRDALRALVARYSAASAADPSAATAFPVCPASDAPPAIFPHP